MLQQKCPLTLFGLRNQTKEIWEVVAAIIRVPCEVDSTNREMFRQQQENCSESILYFAELGFEGSIFGMSIYAPLFLDEDIASIVILSKK